jgi:uncharacterized protein
MDESHFSDPHSAGGESLYNSYGAFLREKFSCRVYKVSVDAGFSCPNRDGTVAVGGCTYCSNSSFRPLSADRSKAVARQVREGIEYLKRRYQADKFIVYFQPYTNTHAPLDVLIPLYETAMDHPDIVGLSVGTRPDCISDDKIAWFEMLARNWFVTLEYGLESIHDRTLMRINRGHDYRCWVNAMNRTRGRGIWICAHLILGFPWETRDEMIGTAAEISNKGLDFLKLHHLHIVRNTPMERDFRENPFPLPGIREYADLVVDFLERLNPAIRIERLFGTAPESKLVGPCWGKSKGQIRHFIESRLAERKAYQGRLYTGGGDF